MDFHYIQTFLTYWLHDTLIIGIHLLLPARGVQGYATDTHGKRLTYRLNGLYTLLVYLCVWYIAARNGYSWTQFYTHLWIFMFSSCILGLIFSALFVFSVHPPPDSKGILVDFFNGRAANPQLRIFGRILDMKMAAYLVGAINLELNILSAFMKHRTIHSVDPNPGITLYTVLFSLWVVDYCFFEHPHLYTYDFVAENLGFKITWGCLCFYPYLYPIGILAIAEKANPQPPTWLLILSAATFFSGWILSRGANNQKWYFKMDPRQTFLGIKPKIIQSKDGKQRVLCSGFWGVARHVNYLGELLIATGLTMSLGHLNDWRPWSYVVYYILLLLPRQLDDDKRCEERYGDVWREYCEKVPWRIVPWVY